MLHKIQEPNPHPRITRGPPSSWTLRRQQGKHDYPSDGICTVPESSKEGRQN